MTTTTIATISRPPMRHEVKCWVQPFAEFRSRLKLADVRRCDDRDYRRGDELLEREYIAAEQRYTGAALLMRITHITKFAGGLPIFLFVERPEKSPLAVVVAVLSVELLEVGTFDGLRATKVLR